MAVNSRFAEVSEEFLDSLIENSIPEKTKTATKYGMKIFNGKKGNRKRILLINLLLLSTHEWLNNTLFSPVCTKNCIFRVVCSTV